MPTQLKRLISPTDTEAQRLAKLTEALADGLSGDVRRQVTATSNDTAATAEDKWRRAVTESLATVQSRSVSTGAPQYIHYQDTPAQTWQIIHNMDGYPAVAVADSSGRMGFGKVTYVSPQELRVEFSSGFSGKAFLVL